MIYMAMVTPRSMPQNEGRTTKEMGSMKGARR